MKCTDFYKKEKELKRIAIEELRNAIQVHGGKYNWTEDEDGNVTDGSERPCICVFTDNGGPEDVEISEISYGKDGWMFTGEITRDCWDYCFSDPYDICSAFQIQTITEMVPETDDIDDVTVKQPQAVSWLSHEDLMQRGFDPEGVTNETLQEIATRMGNYYLDCGYWDDMEDACRFFEIEKLQ